MEISCFVRDGFMQNIILNHLNPFLTVKQSIRQLVQIYSMVFKVMSVLWMMNLCNKISKLIKISKIYNKISKIRHMNLNVSYFNLRIVNDSKTISILCLTTPLITS